uniref:H/ACA ribonucleoprotein complex subunit 2 n=1 Tax=Leptobrachium leishanense TaxID=445787 RepID=A0A8C5MHY0_9ANUR
MTKIKEEDPDETIETPERSYSDLLANLNPIAKPLAGRKLTKKIYKCIKKAVKQKNIRRGVKEVQKFLNKGEKGIVVLAGDTLPIEVYCHIPVMCEDLSIPYAYTPSKTVSRKCNFMYYTDFPLVHLGLFYRVKKNKGRNLALNYFICPIDIFISIDSIRKFIVDSKRLVYFSPN